MNIEIITNEELDATFFRRMLGIHSSTSTEDQVDYHEYIQSEAWKQKANDAKDAAGYRCQLCNTSGYVSELHAHHRTYERLGAELPTDLIALCDECHKLFHEHRKVNQTKKIGRVHFLGVLKHHGITMTNEDPYLYYEKGKRIIQHIVDGINSELYDHYNKINIEVLDVALLNRDRSEFREAMDKNSYADDPLPEYEIRCELDFWEGWHKCSR